MFLRFFGLGVLAFEITKRHVERFISDAASPQRGPSSGWPTTLELIATSPLLPLSSSAFVNRRLFHVKTSE